MSSPDLFVVCKSCGAEVSPYITECPYCGNRLRKRAPKLEKPGKPQKPPRPSRGTRRVRPRHDIATRPGKPWGTFLIVGLSVLATLAATLSTTVAENTLLYPGVWDEDPWRLVTTLFVYDSDGYEAVLLGAVFLFGWLLERRHGPVVVVVVFLLAGVAGTVAASAVDDSIFLLGAPGAAAGLLAAWAVPYLGGTDDEDVDLLGAGVFALLLLALPLAVREAHFVEGVAGALTGLLLGLPLARAHR
jgi:membrane associated rhomboid family serine protease